MVYDAARAVNTRDERRERRDERRETRDERREERTGYGRSFRYQPVSLVSPLSSLVYSALTRTPHPGQKTASAGIENPQAIQSPASVTRPAPHSGQKCAPASARAPCVRHRAPAGGVSRV